MAETDGPPVGPVNNPADFPPQLFPVIFADGVWSASISPNIVKFYLGRIDPSLKSDNTSSWAIFAQIAMPIQGFVTAALFFDTRVKALIKQGYITEEVVESLRNNLPPQKEE